ncbi:unnamed protein product [Arctia plantaginis]|uniref:Uncharacterized protein n=1 Tax=Arctia plantaginis TaxID=874455 RepID=A0A8S0YQD6_ARCPL|nr:unnamed protein product [Arctia plantaginis]
MNGWWRGSQGSEYGGTGMRRAGLFSGIAFRYLAVISLSERVAGPGGDTPELSPLYTAHRTGTSPCVAESLDVYRHSHILVIASAS